ncbi:MAG: NADH-quinone oxidoreductase subunit J [Acidobacteriota bacterium]
MEQLVFYVFAAVSVVAALLVVLQRRAIYSTLALIVCFGAIAALFYQLGAFFIAAIQVIVYAGAIMVLFLFVVMLIDPESEIFAVKRIRNLAVLALPMAALVGLILLSAVSATAGEPEAAAAPGDVASIAEGLFSSYLLPFEVTSILILVAVLGAMVLAKRTD